MTRRSLLAATVALPSYLGAQSGEVGFTSLFDGTNLDGWTVQDGPSTAFYVKDGAIVVHEAFGFPAWLRSTRQYENFDFRGEFFLKGWMDSGIYLHAPEHGRPMWNGMQIHLFHQNDEKPMPQSMGAVFPVIAPIKINVKNQGEWNSFRILMDWPRLQVWTNEELIQDLDVDSTPELRRPLPKRLPWLRVAFLSHSVSQFARKRTARRKRNGRSCTAVRQTSISGTSPMENRMSRLRATFCMRMVMACWQRKRSSAISNCSCTSATRNITTEEFCFELLTRLERFDPMRYSCMMWKGRTTRPVRCTHISARTIPRSSPRCGFHFSCS